MDSAELRSVADELYALPIGSFTTSRNLRAKEAKKRGAEALSLAILALKKPTSAAWSMNSLVRTSPDALDAVSEVRDRIESITATGDRDDLRAATRDRRTVVAKLVADARSVAAESGLALSEASSAEVSDAVLAALGDEDVELALRTGRVVALPRTGGMTANEILDLVAAPPDGLAQNRDESDDDADSGPDAAGSDASRPRRAQSQEGPDSSAETGSRRSPAAGRTVSERSTAERRRLERDLAAAEGAAAAGRADRLSRETGRDELTARRDVLREDLARARHAVRMLEGELADADDALDSLVADIRSRELEWKRAEAAVRRLRRLLDAPADDSDT
ncbi:MAG: hypothetical protein ABWY83_05465 [Actinomycetota bacterium]